MSNYNLPRNIPNLKDVRIKIVEQPAARSHRFRYVGEREATTSRPFQREVSIQGVNSTPTNLKFPTIEIEGYSGKVKIVVSCVTKDQPYRSHPNTLVGERCEFGVCTVRLDGPPMRVIFDRLKIRRVQMKNVEAALKERESLKIHPFGTHSDHKNTVSRAELKSVRLCFQCFIGIEGTYYELTPVVSEPIYNTERPLSNLAILQLCSYSAKASGGSTLFLFCEQFSKDDIKVRFYEELNNELYWEDFGIFQETDVHREVGIALKTPPYRDVNIQDGVEIYIQLYRPSDGKKGEPRRFMFVPDKIKRKRIDPKLLLETLQDQIQNNDESATNYDSRFKPNLQVTVPLPASSANVFDVAEPKPCASMWNQQLPKVATLSSTTASNAFQRRPYTFPNYAMFNGGINQESMQWNNTQISNICSPNQTNTVEQSDITNNIKTFGNTSQVLFSKQPIFTNDESQVEMMTFNSEDQNMTLSTLPTSYQKTHFTVFGRENLTPINQTAKLPNKIQTSAVHATGHLNSMLSPLQYANVSNISDNNIINNFASNLSHEKSMNMTRIFAKNQNIQNTVSSIVNSGQYQFSNVATDLTNTDACVETDVDFNLGNSDLFLTNNTQPLTVQPDAYQINRMLNHRQGFNASTNNITYNCTLNTTQYPDINATNNSNQSETASYENSPQKSYPHQSINSSAFNHDNGTSNNISSITSRPQNIDSANVRETANIWNTSEDYLFQISNNTVDLYLDILHSDLDNIR